MSDVDNSEGSRQRRWPIAALVALVFLIVTSPFTLTGLAFWAASESWEFAGGGLRHWVFIKGSTVDRLGFVTATGEPARYVVRLGEGTDPGETLVVYDSDSLPEDVAGAYAERCPTMGLTIKKRAVAPDATEARLVCEGDQSAAVSDDAWIIATRPAVASTTQVRIIAGPGLTATYEF